MSSACRTRGNHNVERPHNARRALIGAQITAITYPPNTTEVKKTCTGCMRSRIAFCRKVCWFIFSCGWLQCISRKSTVIKQKALDQAYKRSKLRWRKLFSMHWQRLNLDLNILIWDEIRWHLIQMRVEDRCCDYSVNRLESGEHEFGDNLVPSNRGVG